MRLSLRWKIVGGYGLLLLLFVLLGWVTLSLFSSLRSVQQRVFERALPELVAVDEIIRSYTAQSAAVSRFLISSDQRLLVQFEEEVAIAEEWEQRARVFIPNDAEERLLDELANSGRAFQKVVTDEVVPLASEGQRSQAFRALTQEGNPLISRIEMIGTQLKQAQDEVVAQTERDLDLRQQQVVIILVLTLIGAFSIGLLLTIVVPRRLVGGLDELVQATRRIQQGNLDQEIVVRSGDEVEELAAQLNEMQGGLKRLQQLALQDRELEIASSIQRRLLPREIPTMMGAKVIPTQRQANLVGGDWYDFENTARTLSVAVGDASGKGIAAALMATVALSALRAERGLGSPPSKIVARANQALLEATEDDSFTTLIYASLDLDTGDLRCLNMGHLSPFLVRRAGEGPPTGAYTEGPRNRALGWFDDPGLAEMQIHMRPGDRLHLFTDGFLEAKGADGELFGEERLAETLVGLGTLDAGEVGDEMIREVERFAAGKLEDDLTMLILDFEGASDGAGDA